jgi:hypothetical protein
MTQKRSLIARRRYADGGFIIAAINPVHDPAGGEQIDVGGGNLGRYRPRLFTRVDVPVPRGQILAYYDAR